MMTRYLILTAFALLMAGCSKSGSSAPSNSAEDDLDVYEAVFRYRLQIQKYPADVKVFISVDGKDPSAELLQRLHKDWPNLQPVSEEPKDKGRRIYVRGLKWGDSNTAELKAGYWFPTKFAGEGYFADHHLIRRNGQWVVEKITNETSS